MHKALHYRRIASKVIVRQELKAHFSLFRPPLAKDIISDKQSSNVKNHKGNRQVSFKDGANVFVRDYSNPNKDSWEEATVDKRIGSQTYRCILTRNSKPIKRHVDQIISGATNQEVNPDLKENNEQEG